MYDTNDSVKRIEALWRNGRDVPVTEDGTFIDEDWPDLDGGVFFEKGSELMQIWTEFDHLHPKGVHYLLYELEG